MANMVKKTSILFFVIVLFTSCTNSKQIHEDIKKQTEEFMQLFINDDIDELEDYFCQSISDNEKQEYLTKLKASYDSIDGKVIHHEYISEGGGQASKRSGKVTYYSCYPEYLIKTDKEKEYKIVLSYNFINRDEPENEGIYKFELYDCQTNNKTIIGTNI